jgi:hypothetical protein
MSVQELKSSGLFFDGVIFLVAVMGLSILAVIAVITIVAISVFAIAGLSLRFGHTLPTPRYLSFRFGEGKGKNSCCVHPGY